MNQEAKTSQHHAEGSQIIRIDAVLDSRIYKMNPQLLKIGCINGVYEKVYEKVWVQDLTKNGSNFWKFSTNKFATVQLIWDHE